MRTKLVYSWPHLQLGQACAQAAWPLKRGGLSHDSKLGLHCSHRCQASSTHALLPGGLCKALPRSLSARMAARLLPESLCHIARQTTRGCTARGRARSMWDRRGCRRLWAASASPWQSLRTPQRWCASPGLHVTKRAGMHAKTVCSSFQGLIAEKFVHGRALHG